MTEMLHSLLPLALGSAIVPMQLLITVLLLRSERGRAPALGFVGGMAVVRLVQGFLFGFVFTAARGASTSASHTSVRDGIILLAVACLFLVTGVRNARQNANPDAASPGWMRKIRSAGARMTFMFGVVSLSLAPKFWVFTIGAIAAIEGANLGTTGSIAAYVIFTIVALSAHLAVIGVVTAMPDQSSAALETIGQWLERNNRVIMIALCSLFTPWFLYKALVAFGVL